MSKNQFLKFLLNIKERLANLLYPQIRCLACRREAPLNERGLCENCREALAVYAPIHTEIGGIKCLAALHYGDKAASGLVKSLKFTGLKHSAPILAGVMAELIAKSGVKCDIIVPVPISKQRMRDRGFNQSCLIGEIISGIIGVPCEQPLVKIRNNSVQSSLSREQRQRNVKGAYACADVLGKSILLIDDVITTGATALECVKTLLESGAESVVICCAAMADPSDYLA